MDGFTLPHDLRLRNWNPHPGEILDAADIRHCVVGDQVAVALGGRDVPTDVLVAIPDEQIDAAYAALASHGYRELSPKRGRFGCHHATKESRSDWPGYLFLHERSSPSAIGIHIIPSTYWHVDLSHDSWGKNTIRVSNTRWRFPHKLFYLSAMIDIVAERYGDSGFNGQITAYLQCHYYSMLLLSQEVIPSLSSADRFFLNLFSKVMIPSVRSKVCEQRKRIREGATTYEEAESLIPRKDLQLAALKAKHKARLHSPAEAQAEGTKHA